jgi:hypothetical protein
LLIWQDFCQGPGLMAMRITTGATEVGLLARADGRYEVALYHRSNNRLIRFDIDPALAWAISGALGAPITAEELTLPG